MIPALRRLLDSFPFVIHGFHADNGSEYINHEVAALLDDMLIELTKSRPGKSTDNALAESKNNSVVRKFFGYAHIPQAFADRVDNFNREQLNPTLNFHRPCHFPTVEIDDKGRKRRRYRHEDVMTPFEKLKSLPPELVTLREGITIDMLKKQAREQTDIDAWKQLRNHQRRLFDEIFRTPQKAAG